LYDIEFSDQGVNLYVKMLHGLINRWSHDRCAGRSPLDDGQGFTIRFSYPDDETALQRLAALDSQPILAAPALVAEVGGELWAAVSLGGEPRAIADPFRPTAELVALLGERSQRLTRRGRDRSVARPIEPVTVPSR
jgi:hypothetical protein